MIWVLPAFILPKYPLTFLKPSEFMSFMQEGSNIDAKNYYMHVKLLNAEAHGVGRVH
jgi:hypothetical protein